VADAAAGIDAETYQTSVFVYDSLGDMHSITINFERTASNTWSWTTEISGSNTIAIWQGDPPAEAAAGSLTFNDDGSIATGGEAELHLSGAGGAGNPLENGAGEMVVSIDLSGLVQFARSFTPVPSHRNGHGAGALDSVSFDGNGTLIGTFTNGATQTLAQLVLADFFNPSGLAKVGENLYNVSMNSGPPVIGAAGSSIRATIVPGALEGSNVDLANEFTKMIVAQRGFEANSRLVMTSDAILGELINLKR
jgi:flagellar hook protein FlgE